MNYKRGVTQASTNTLWTCSRPHLKTWAVKHGAVTTKSATCFCSISFIHVSQLIIWMVFKERDSLTVCVKGADHKEIYGKLAEIITQKQKTVGGEQGMKHRITFPHYTFFIKKDQPVKENLKHIFPGIINLRFKNVPIICKVKCWDFISNYMTILSNLKLRRNMNLKFSSIRTSRDWTERYTLLLTN